MLKQLRIWPEFYQGYIYKTDVCLFNFTAVKEVLICIINSTDKFCLMLFWGLCKICYWEIQSEKCDAWI